MKKIVLGMVLIGVFVIGSAQNGHAFWGKKKSVTPDTSTEQVQPAATPQAVTPVPEKKAMPDKTVKPVAAETMAKPAVSNAKANLSPTEAKALAEKVRKNLDNTSWNTDIFPIAGGGKVRKDDLIFKDNKFSSKDFSAKGFTATNYTLTTKDNGVTIWETMQSAENGQIIFWRGEMDENLTEMRGVLSQQKAPGESEDFTFVSKGKSALQ
jgi:hypothetical protein